MRIGRIMINTEEMTIEELKAVEHELHRIRRRREQAAEFSNRLNELIAEAKAAGFTFVDKDFGQVLTENDCVMYDEQP